MGGRVKKKTLKNLYPTPSVTIHYCNPCLLVNLNHHILIHAVNTLIKITIARLSVNRPLSRIAQTVKDFASNLSFSARLDVQKTKLFVRLGLKMAAT